MIEEEYLAHYGILNQVWGMRRYQYTDGKLTPEGYERYYGDKKNKDKLTIEEQTKIASKIKARILAKPRPADVIKYQDLFNNNELKQLSDRFQSINSIQKNVPKKKKNLVQRIVANIGDTLTTNLSSSLGVSSRIFLDKMIAETMNVPLQTVQSYDKNKGDKNKDNKNKNNKNKNKDSDSDK